MSAAPLAPAPFDPAPFDAARGARIIAIARAWVGTPYRHQASLLGEGCDCLGLVRGVWREAVGPEPEAAPPYAPDWAEAAGQGPDDEPLLAAALRHFAPVPLAGAMPGDVLAFRWREGLAAKHLGVATAPGAGAMVHAHDGARVAEVALVPAWRRRLVAAFRFPGPRFPGPRFPGPRLPAPPAPERPPP